MTWWFWIVWMTQTFQWSFSGICVLSPGKKTLLRKQCPETAFSAIRISQKNWLLRPVLLIPYWVSHSSFCSLLSRWGIGKKRLVYIINNNCQSSVTLHQGKNRGKEVVGGHWGLNTELKSRSEVKHRQSAAAPGLSTCCRSLIARNCCCQ